MKKWTQDELDFLEKNWDKLNPQRIADKLNRSKRSVTKKIFSLHPEYRVSKIWDEEDINFLINNYQHHGNMYLKNKLHKNIEDIKAKMQELKLTGVRTNTDYNDLSDDEIEFVKQNYNSMSDFELTDKINEKRKQIKIPLISQGNLGRIRTHILKLRRKKGGNAPNLDKNKWTPDQDQYVIDNYYYQTLDTLAKHFNRSLQSISSRALKIGLVKCPGKYFDQDKKQFLKENIDNMTINQLVDHLKIPAIRIIAQASSMKLIHEIRAMTLPEQKVKDELDRQGICYKFSEKLQLTKTLNIFPDFLIGNNVLEIQGDYYHCNPEFYPPEKRNYQQKEQMKRDKFKKDKMEKLGYNVIYLWENDILNNFSKVSKIIASLLGD